MLYAIVLWVHSWLRWVVILLGVATLGRAIGGWRGGRPWRPLDRGLQVAFTASLDTQVLFGLLLYFVLSPFTPKSTADLGASMKVTVLRFFAVEHVFSMTIALAIAHVAAVKARRAPDDATRHRRVAIGVGCALLAIAIGIPWPFMPYGRPLARFW